MKKSIAAITVFSLIIMNVLLLSSCSIPTNAPIDSPEDTEQSRESLPDNLGDFELIDTPAQKGAIIHMIRPVPSLENWQSGKTQPEARLYVDDMMKVFDELEWKISDDHTLVSGDFDFRINMYRPSSELVPYKDFITQTDVSIFPENSDEQKDISVQYLINYTDGTVNMRFFDYSAQVFDVYAKMNENQTRIIMLCLKYYFGPIN